MKSILIIAFACIVTKASAQNKFDNPVFNDAIKKIAVHAQTSFASITGAQKPGGLAGFIINYKNNMPLPGADSASTVKDIFSKKVVYYFSTATLPEATAMRKNISVAIQKALNHTFFEHINDGGKDYKPDHLFYTQARTGGINDVDFGIYIDKSAKKYILKLEVYEQIAVDLKLSGFVDEPDLNKKVRDYYNSSKNLFASLKGKLVKEDTYKKEFATTALLFGKQPYFTEGKYDITLGFYFKVNDFASETEAKATFNRVKQSIVALGNMLTPLPSANSNTFSEFIIYYETGVKSYDSKTSISIGYPADINNSQLSIVFKYNK